MMTGRDHAKLLGLFFWLLTGLQVAMVAFIGFFYVFLFGFIFTQMPHDKGAPPPEFIIPFIIFIVAILVLTTVLFSVPKVVAGYGLRKEKSWARVWAIVACCLAVTAVPFGTAVGVYGLIFLFGDNGKAYFEDPNYGRLSGAALPTIAAPEPNSWQ